MAYFVEYHESGKWETNNVSTLYMEEWDQAKLLSWFEDTFWVMERAGVTIADVLEEDPIVTCDTPPLIDKFFSWSPFEDDQSVQIFTV